MNSRDYYALPAGARVVAVEPDGVSREAGVTVGTTGTLTSIPGVVRWDGVHRTQTCLPAEVELLEHAP